MISPIYIEPIPDIFYSSERSKQMTNEQIERLIEIRTNAADNALMSGRMTQKEYDFHMRVLNRWADRKMERAAA